MNALVVDHFELRSRALLVFFDERELSGWLVLLASGPVQEVERLNATSVGPQRRFRTGSLGYLVRTGGKRDGDGDSDARSIQQFACSIHWDAEAPDKVERHVQHRLTLHPGSQRAP